MTKDNIDDIFKILEHHKKTLLSVAKEIDDIFDDTIDVLYSNDGEVVSYFVLKGMDFLGEMNNTSMSRNSLFSRLLLMKPTQKKAS